MPVSGCLPKTFLRVTLAELMMLGIRKANKEETTMKATMVLNPDLRGRFTTRFASETGGTSEASVEFNGAHLLNRADGSNTLLLA